MSLFRKTLSSLRGGLGRTRRALVGSLERLDEVDLEAIEACLLEADVGAGATEELLDDLRRAVRRGEHPSGDALPEFLGRRLLARLGDADRSLALAEAPPTVFLVTGVNGSGKTTSIAKIASALLEDGHSVLLAAGDTFRAGAVAQLDTWATRLGVDLVHGSDGADPAAVVFDSLEAAEARGIDVVLIDTAGRLHTQDPLMRQLGKILRVIERRVPGAPHESLLVLDATQGQNALAQARHFAEAAGVTGLVLAKLDGTARGGIVVAIQDALGLPVKLVGVGERPADLEPFEPLAFVEALLDVRLDRDEPA